MVTLYDVARQAGVSIATVSRVLHGLQPVRESTATRVRAAIEELGYVPDGAAQSLARSRKDVIGLVAVEHMGLEPRQFDYAIESMSLLYYDEVMRGVESRIRDRDWSLLITYLREDETGGPLGAPGPGPNGTNGTGAPSEDEPVLPRLLRLSGKVDGLLIGEGVVPESALARLAKRLPVVIIAGDTGLRSTNVVAADNWSGAHALVTHLIVEHGRRRLFHIDGPPTAPDAKMRRLALLDVIAGRPGATLVGASSGRFSVRSGADAAEQMLADFGADLPDAIVCANDQMAIGVLRTLDAHAIRVPHDIAVVGFDDIYHATLSSPPLTTVRQPTRGIGERACERLIELIADPALRPAVELLPTELVIRSSCGCPPGTEEHRPVPPVAAQAAHPLARPAPSHRPAEHRPAEHRPAPHRPAQHRQAETR